MKRRDLPKDHVKEPQKLRKEFKENRITAAYLREHCRRNELYMIPKFNDVLYLHFKVLRTKWALTLFRVCQRLRTWRSM